MELWTIKEGQQLFEIPFQAGHGLGGLPLPASFPVPEVTDGFGLVRGWRAVTNADLAGYRFYQGPATNTFNTNFFVGNFTNYTITGLIPGSTYWFAVTALSTNSLQSDFSNEIAYTVPTTNVVQTNVLTQPILQRQYTGDLIHWTNDGAPFTDAYGGFKIYLQRLTHVGDSPYQTNYTTNAPTGLTQSVALPMPPLFK